MHLNISVVKFLLNLCFGFICKPVMNSLPCDHAFLKTNKCRGKRELRELFRKQEKNLLEKTFGEHFRENVLDIELRIKMKINFQSIFFSL